jgi:hypothetical protein
MLMFEIALLLLVRATYFDVAAFSCAWSFSRARLRLQNASRSYRSSAAARPNCCANCSRLICRGFNNIISSWRTPRMRDNSKWSSAISLAAASRSAPSVKARAMMSIFMAMTPSIGNGPDKPCRKALRLELNCPISVFGPVLSLALARLAAICFAVAIEFFAQHVPRLLCVQMRVLSSYRAGPKIGFVLKFFQLPATTMGFRLAQRWAQTARFDLDSLPRKAQQKEQENCSERTGVFAQTERY